MNTAIRTVNVALGKRSYQILISPGLLDADSSLGAEQSLAPFLKDKSVLVVADSNTAPLFAEQLQILLLKAGAKSFSLFSFPAGEKAKTMATVEKITRCAADHQLDRSSVLVALGGGVTGDLTGFAAAIYMRGIDFIQIPTSLLAMVDSSVGGKTGADLPEGKNLIGAFHQPKLVLMDPKFLRSLPTSQLASGFAELIKHGVILDRSLFHDLEQNASVLISLQNELLLTDLLARSCAIKGKVVAKDEREGSCRALLNYGHSFGHAIEKRMHFSGISHGAAISIGMCMAADLAVAKRLLSPRAAKRQEDLLKSFLLPVSVAGLKPASILNAMYGDKKNIGGILRLVIPVKIGQARIHSSIDKKSILLAIGGRCD